MAQSPTAAPNYVNNVFVNCPFDAEYLPLFRALIFAIEYCGFSARCALEVEDSGEVRVEKIIRLIRGSRLGIHDISRTESNAEGLPRFNMPYEFGLFTGFQRAGNAQQQQKAALVLDREQYRYQKFLSDIAGQDIKSHRGDAEQVVKVVRDWLRGKTDRKLAGSAHIIAQFRQFQADLPVLLTEARLGASDLDNYLDFHKLVTEWIAANNVRA
jgi:hypothetical protein